jgi:hypothetical protein
MEGADASAMLEICATLRALFASSNEWRRHEFRATEGHRNDRVTDCSYALILIMTDMTQWGI